MKCRGSAVSPEEGNSEICREAHIWVWVSHEIVSPSSHGDQLNDHPDDLVGQIRDSFPSLNDVFSPGTTIDNRFRILGRLSRGPRGEVYVAEHIFLEEKLAIRILHDVETLGDDIEGRFIAEAKSLSRVNHKNIVKLFDIGVTSNGYLFATMELLKGKTLQEWLTVHLEELKQGDSNERFSELFDYLRQVAGGLIEAHENGVFHHNLKPSNIYLNETEREDGSLIKTPKLIDFGRLSIRGEDEAEQDEHHYLAPEIRRGAEGDERADVYSFGIILCYALTGDLPEIPDSGARDSADDVLAQVRANSPAATALNEIVRKAISSDVENRYPTIRDLIDALESTLNRTGSVPEGDPHAAVIELERDRRILKWGVGMLILMVAGLAIAGGLLLNRLDDGVTEEAQETSIAAGQLPSPITSDTPETGVKAGLALKGATAAGDHPLETHDDAPSSDDSDLREDEENSPAALSTDSDTDAAPASEKRDNGSKEESKLSRKEKSKIRACTKDAKTAIKERRWKDAQKSLEEVVALNPLRANAWLDLGRIAYSRGAFETAVTNVQKALDLRDRATWRLLYGEYLYRNGNKNEAIEAWRQVVEKYPNVRPEIEDKARHFLRKAGVRLK
jgi:serine/threonine protein kinase